ncbi:nucleotidyl transferase AbiEii/AbiGii toxin family protein [Bradyrhizobium sp. AUGA SZCCT0240]|nr:nucleotidyl transferase AbiEii/AbiGii toxin family protein [Bradyrhizobium sp. AUGA SZCCT0274]MBR1252569.1 nucleotidyl transferase AbiEii/AbiGii toxin family protein [Bradyrhizobium sp. AUGA SZCCT0240]
MLHSDHRLSKDIDAFIDDPQYLGIMSPDVTDVWDCRTWDQAAHYLKLGYPEGEIDFIVSSPLSDLATTFHGVDLTDLPAKRKVTIEIEHPAEIALKKMHYRPTMLKSRDIFDIAVADSIDHEALIGNLHEISDKQNALRKRLDAIDPKFLQAELAELDIQEGWDDQKKNCLETARSLVEQIP